MKLAIARKDALLLVALTLLWGINWPIMKAGVRDFPPLLFRTICIGGGAVVLGLVAWAHRTPLAIERAHRAELTRLALVNVVGWSVLSIWGIQQLASGRAAILGFTMPVWVTLIGLVFYRQGITRAQGLGVAAAAGVVALLAGAEARAMAGRPLGVALMIGAAIAWAVGTQWMNRRRVRAPMLALTFWMLVLATAVCGLLSLLLEWGRWKLPTDGAAWGALVYNVLLVSGVAQLIWFRLATVLTPAASALSVMLVPCVGLLAGMAMLGERPSAADLGALALSMVSIGSVLLGRRT